MNDISPSEKDDLLAAGKTVMKAGKFDDAERIFRRILENEPEEPDALNQFEEYPHMLTPLAIDPLGPA